jgi:hypothetical protein
MEWVCLEGTSGNRFLRHLHHRWRAWGGMAHLYRLIVCVLLTFSAFSAAASVPTVTQWRNTSYQTSVYFYSPEEACDNAVSWLNANGGGHTYTTHYCNDVSSRHWINRLTSTGSFTLDYVKTTLGTRSACPLNSTSGGGGCVCNSGFVEDSTHTFCEVDPLVAACSALQGQSAFVSVPGTAGVNGTVCADTGCSMQFTGTVMRIGGTSPVTKGDARFTGSTCTASPTTQATPDPCPSGATGEVNGLTVCVPPADTNVVESVKVGTTTSSVTSGSGTSTLTTTNQETTVCQGGRCTVTSTISTPGGGSTSTVSNVPQSDACKANPSLPACSSSGSFSGSCTGGFVCKGDVVNCATAKAVNDQYCQLKEVFEMDAETSGLAESVKAGTWVTNPKDNPTVVALGVFDQTNPLGESCPPDVTVNLSWGSFVVPMFQHCDRFKMVGNLLVLVSLIGATLFVVRGNS